MEVADKLLYWETELNAITGEVIDLCGGLSEEQLNFKPTSENWSIGQHLSHLIIINSSYYSTIEEFRSGENKAPWQGRVDFLVKLFGKLILKSVQPDNKKKTRTFPIWEPDKSAISGDIVERFKNHQKEFMVFMNSCKDLLEQRAVIPSPANRTIQYYLETAFEIIITHEKRHILHIKECMALLDQ